MSDSVAAQALETIVGMFDAVGGAIFELADTNDGCFQSTASVGILGEPCGSSTRFPDGSLLPRWLRVNARVLPIPDAIGVWAALGPEEQATLRRLGANLAVPLLVDEELTAWVGLCRAAGANRGPIPVPKEVLSVAATLHSAKRAAVQRARSEVVVRSNRLSVAGQMAAGIAHEVRNPLAAVRSMVQLVRSDRAPAGERDRLLDSAMAEVDRVNRVLSGMMNLGRPTSARDERIDLTALAVDAVSFCQSYAKHRGETIHLSGAESHWIRGDAHELRQVLVNLLLNACQASRRGDTVEVECDSTLDDQGRPVARLRVTDGGEGMRRSVLDRIFEPFFTTKPQGGGLGLSICREAIQRHGGSITVASEPSVGTAVTIELPMIKS